MENNRKKIQSCDDEDPDTAPVILLLLCLLGFSLLVVFLLAHPGTKDQTFTNNILTIEEFLLKNGGGVMSEEKAKSKGQEIYTTVYKSYNKEIEKKSDNDATWKVDCSDGEFIFFLFTNE